MLPRPTFDDIAASLATLLGGTVRALDDEGESAAIELSGACPVLVRRHAQAAGISLPNAGSWTVRRASELPAIASAVRAGLARGPGLAIADVVLALRARLTPGWTLHYPGTPVPDEAWLKRGGESIGLFQGKGVVRVVIWAGNALEERTVGPAAPLDVAWLEASLSRQREVLSTEAAERARRAALPPPDVSEVLEALRRGARIQVGGGRAFETWHWSEGLHATIFDEGDVRLRPRTVKALAEAIARSPDPFRDALRR